MQKKLFWLLFILAFLFRLVALNQSLWLDEAVVANAVQKYSYLELITKFSLHDFHPPLYYLFIKFWTNLFGYSEIALRAPSVLFSLGTGYLLYLSAGSWPALFFLFNPLIVYYSQEARPYMLLTFCLTLALYALEQLNKSKSQYLTILLVALALSLFTFYGSIFFIASLIFYFVYQRKSQLAVLSLLTTVLVLAVLSPLLVKQWQNARVATSLVLNWKQVLGPASLKNLLLIPLKFSFGRISFYPKILYYLLAGFWSLFVWSWIIRYRAKNSKYYILLLLPIILGFIFSLFTPLLQYFRFIYLIPLMVILLANNAKANFIKSLLLTGFIVLSLIYLFMPQFHREDWQSLSQALPNNSLVLGIPSSLEGLKYYSPQIKLQDIRSLGSLKPKPGKITVVPYTLVIYGIDYPKLVQKQGYYQASKLVFRELELVVWEK